MAKGRGRKKGQSTCNITELRECGSRLKKTQAAYSRTKKETEDLAKFPSEDPYPVLRISRDGTLLYANIVSGPLIKEWGTRAGELVPADWREIVTEVLNSGLREIVELEHRGRIFSFVVVAVKKGNYVNLYGRDITEEKRAERRMRDAYTELKEAQAQLVQAEKMDAIGRMASGVAHEVKNPLGVILLGINYLEHKLPEAEDDIIEAMQRIKRNIERADNIIRSLLDFSRISQVHKEPNDINTVLAESLDLVQHKVKLTNIRVAKELKEGLPEILIEKER